MQPTYPIRFRYMYLLLLLLTYTSIHQHTPTHPYILTYKLIGFPGYTFPFKKHAIVKRLHFLYPEGARL